MNKLEMAHQWAMKCLESGLTAQISDLVAESWKYADLMQAEEYKRVVKCPDVFFDNKIEDGEQQP